MNEATGQSGDLPSARAQKADEVMDYYGYKGRNNVPDFYPETDRSYGLGHRSIPLPSIVRIAGLIVSGISTGLVMAGMCLAFNTNLFVLFITNSESVPGAFIAVTFVLGGLVMTAIEYFALVRQDERCSLAMAVVLGLISFLPLGLLFAATLGNGSSAAKAADLIEIAVLCFCSLVHYSWAVRLREAASRSP